MEILQKVKSIIKNKFNSELVYSKIYLKAGKNPTQEALNVYMHQ